MGIETTEKELAGVSGLPRVTATSNHKKLTKNVTMTTIKGMSSGFGMAMSEYPDCEYFTGEWLNPEQPDE